MRIVKSLAHFRDSQKHVQKYSTTIASKKSSHYYYQIN